MSTKTGIDPSKPVKVIEGPLTVTGHMALDNALVVGPAQEREWQPGDTALIEVEVDEVVTGPNGAETIEVLITERGESRTYVALDPSQLRPVPGGAVRVQEPAQGDVIERILSAAISRGDVGISAESATRDKARHLYSEAHGATIDVARLGVFIAESLRHRGLLASRPEHVVKAEALREAADSITNNTFVNPGGVAEWLRVRARTTTIVAGLFASEAGEHDD